MFCGLTTNKWPVHRHTSDGWWNPPQLVVYIPYSASALKSTKNLYQKNFYICNCTTQSYTFTLMSISCLIFLTFVNYIIRHCISETRNHMISYSRLLVIWNRFQRKQNSIFFVTFKWLKQFKKEVLSSDFQRIHARKYIYNATTYYKHRTTFQPNLKYPR